jgi:hypothetical protein
MMMTTAAARLFADEPPTQRLNFLRLRRVQFEPNEKAYSQCKAESDHGVRAFCDSSILHGSADIMRKK